MTAVKNIANGMRHKSYC